ncbi:hypothetical protein Q8A73_015407 [Channa argus]|nr:hypothetical protein Q8A73_015407 [Channa argus]
MGFVRPWRRRGSSVCELQYSVFVFVLDRATEGKQMRCNVNSRLLVQHCAIICAPAVRTDCASKPRLCPSRLPDEPLFWEPTRGVGGFLFSTADRDTIRLVHTHF